MNVKVVVVNMAPGQLFLPSPINIGLRQGERRVLAMKKETWDAIKIDKSFATLVHKRALVMELEAQDKPLPPPSPAPAPEPAAAPSRDVDEGPVKQPTADHAEDDSEASDHVDAELTDVLPVDGADEAETTVDADVKTPVTAKKKRGRKRKIAPVNQG